MLQLAIQQLTMDAELARGLGPVARACAQGCADQAAFEAFDGDRQLRMQPVRQRLVGACSWSDRRSPQAEVACVDHLMPHHDPAALHEVLELAHVARPRVLKQGLSSGGRQALGRLVAWRAQEPLGQHEDVGQPVDAMTLIPLMLETFIARNFGFHSKGAVR